MENLYEILEIEKDATKDDIKDSYIRLLRLYPPEKDGERFSKIRNAYEVLSNTKSKEEYDTFLEYGEEIKVLEIKAEKYMDDKNFRKAILNYKKILLFNRNLNYIKNRLGLALAYNEQIDEAISIFLELLEDDSKNPTYNYNLGKVYILKEKYLKAESYLLRASELDSINDGITSALIELYISRKKYTKAIAFLESCIGKYQDDKFRDFTYYRKMIEVYIFEGNKEKLSEIVEKIVSVTPDDENIKNYVSHELVRLSKELYDLDLFDLVKIIVEKAKRIGDEDINEALYEMSDKKDDFYKNFPRLMKDERIMNPLKGAIYFYFSDEEDDEKRKKDINDNLEAVNSCLNYEPGEVVYSIEIMKKEYNSLYKMKEDFYSKVYKIAKENYEVKKEYEDIIKDPEITHGMKRLVSLWMSPDVSDNERKMYFEDIINEISRERTKAVNISSKKIRNRYRNIYMINTGLIDTLVKNTTKILGIF